MSSDDLQTQAPPAEAIAPPADAPLPPADAITPLNAAIGHLARGEIGEALKAASDACHADPNLPPAHYAYGQAWTQRNEHARAEQAFAAAIRLKPDWADAWVNYGLARYRQGAIEDAKTAMRQALRHVPDHPAARANLGAFLRITGEPETAETLLRQTLEREPQNAGARLNLVADLLQEERAAEALALLPESAFPASDLPAARHWRLQQSLALLQLRRPEEARRALREFADLGPLPEEIAPLWFWRQVLLAQAEGDFSRARSQAELMEQALEAMGEGGVPEHRIMAHYDLAKFWSGQDDHARAFAHWTAGHKLLRRSQPFSRDSHLAFVEANIKLLGHARFATGPRAKNDDPTPIFIVGMPRSGTTLAEQILSAHAQAHGAGERTALGRAFHALGGGDGAEAAARIAALGQDALDAGAEAYLRELKALAPDKARIVDKMPGNFNYLGLAGLMLPGARIIHCRRDPRDVGLSIFTFRFHGAHGYAHDLGDLGWYIGQHDRLMAHWKQAMPGAILDIHLSDWVKDFDATLQRVLDHVGLPPDPNCARFHEADSRVRTVSRAQVRQPVNASGLGRWKPYERELAPLIAELRKDDLAR